MASSMVQYGRVKTVFTLLICVLALLYAAPNLLPRAMTEAWEAKYPHWLPIHPVNLGLDLQGGSYLLLKVDLAAARKDRMNNTLDAIRKELLGQKIGYIDLRATDKGVTFALRDAADSEKVQPLIREVDPTLSVDIDRTVVSVAPNEQTARQADISVVNQSIEIVRRRIDETGTKEPLIQRSGEDRILLQLPGVDDPEAIKRILGKTAKMTFHLVNETASAVSSSPVPAEDMRLPMRDEKGRTLVIVRRPALSGETLTDAYANRDHTGMAYVGFRFDSLGAKKFADITRANVGHPFAVVLDGEIITAPNIREPITGGSGQISGNFTIQEANELALLLRAGALPAPLTVLEERTVGPGLGQDAIEAGKLAGTLGFGLIVTLMLLCYGFFGILAAVSLVLTIAMLFAALAVLGATLTLPGIAGIVLTMGLAVDANVLVFERIREESRAGRSPISAVDNGYGNALASIVDSNLTTIIAGILLYMFGSGPVRGFAVTLTLGVIVSMFSALMVTRLMMLTWLKKTRPPVITI